MHSKAHGLMQHGIRWVSAIILMIGLTVAGQAMAKGTEVSDSDLINKATADMTSTAHLAGIHKNELSLDCQACHTENLVPDDNATDVNASCVTCHGSYDKLAAETKKTAKNPNINVHGSHLGPEIGCTTCHQGHVESKTYCVYCHTNFDLLIPGGATKK